MISLQATFPEAVTVTTGMSGAEVVGPRIAFTVGTASRHAVYASGSPGTALVFEYEVAAGDADGDGIAVAANALANHGGSAIALSSDGTAAALDHTAVAASASHAVDGVRPAVESATVSGTALTITFEEELGAAASLAHRAFTVKRTRAGTEATVGLSMTTAPSLSGATVTLTLASPLLAADTAVKVSYAKPSTGTDNAIVDAAGNPADSFTDQVVSNTADTTAPTVSGASVNRATLTITFSENLDTTAAPPAGVFSVAGRSTSVTAVGFKSGDATKVELTLSPAVSHRDTGITVSYRKGSSPAQGRQRQRGGELHGADGGQQHRSGHGGELRWRSRRRRETTRHTRSGTGSRRR